MAEVVKSCVSVLVANHVILLLGSAFVKKEERDFTAKKVIQSINFKVYK